MQNEFKDRRLKYVDAPKVFNQKANDINITAKQHLRACAQLAKHLSNKKSKNPKEFEQDEWMKDFVVKSAALNEKTIAIIDYMAEFLTQIAQDASILIEGSKIMDIVRDQSEAITLISETRGNLVKDVYEMKKDEFRRNKAVN